MSNSYGQDGWGQQPPQGDQWGQNPQGNAQPGAYGQSPADPGVPQYGAYAQPGQPQYGAYAPQGQGSPYGQQVGQNAQYGQQAGPPAYPQDGNPFAAPAGHAGMAGDGGMGGYGGPVERPGTLKAACIILWVIAGLAILGGLAFFALEPADLGLHGDDEAIIATVGVVVIVVGALYAFLAFLLWKGSNVARIILTVLLGLSLLGSLSTFAQGGADAGGSVLGLVLVILVLVFIWQRSSSEYMRYRAATKN